MIELLLLYRIDLQRRGRCVAQAIELSALIHADEAKPGLPFPNVAMPWAQVAVHAPVRHGLPPAAFVERFRFLKYFQFIHGNLRKGNFSPAQIRSVLSILSFERCQSIAIRFDIE